MARQKKTRCLIILHGGLIPVEGVAILQAGFHLGDGHGFAPTGTPLLVIRETSIYFEKQYLEKKRNYIKTLVGSIA